MRSLKSRLTFRESYVAFNEKGLGVRMAVKHDIKKAREVVADYLIAYVGEKAVAGTPHFDAERKVWSVPVPCYTQRGIFLGGKIELDERLEIIYAPSKSEFTRVVEEQLKRLPIMVYANEDELAAKGFEVAKMI
jgi:hypothetical protein